MFAMATMAAEPAGKKSVPSKKQAPNTVTVDGQTYVLPGEPVGADANSYLLKKFDLNGDGRIDEAEIAAAQKKLSTNALPPTPRTSDGRPITIKDLYDGGRSINRSKNAAGDDDIMRKIDKNGDGIIDAAEIVAFRRELDRKAGREDKPREAEYVPPFQPVKGDIPKPLPAPKKKAVR